MKLNQNRIKFSTRDFNRKTFNEEAIILPVQFVDKIQNGQWAVLMGTKFKVRGYPAQGDNNERVYVLGFKNKDGIVIQNVIDVNDLLQLYLIFSSVREGFGAVYKAGDRDSGFELEIRRNSHGEYVIQVIKEGEFFTIVGEDVVICKELLYLFHWMLLSENALEYIDGPRPTAGMTVAEVIRKIKKSKANYPEDFLRDDKLRDYLAQFGLEIVEMAEYDEYEEEYEEEPQPPIQKQKPFTQEVLEAKHMPEEPKQPKTPIIDLPGKPGDLDKSISIEDAMAAVDDN